jgi:hypothetical protein
MERILFYHLNEPYGEFSNFSPHRIWLKGRGWRTTEHFFQAQKFAGTEHEEAVRLAKTPTVAARLGRSRSRPLRPDWDEVKEAVMREALRAKFTQHPELRALLLATGEAKIVEHTERDRYWGDGGDGSGKNRMGRLLMELRGQLRAEGTSAGAGERILFHRPSGRFGEFSNFSPHRISLKGQEWRTVEHYYQAQKFAGTAHEEEIRLIKTPTLAARLGRKLPPLRPDWEAVKEAIMGKALRAKFTQHPDLCALLLATGEAEIVEHTADDPYWGDGGDGSGKGRLGALLMDLRAQLRTEGGTGGGRGDG